MKSDEVFLRHILDELDFRLKRTGGIDFDEFVADDVLRRNKHKDVEWTKIAGLRDKLIHGYFDVDLGILWDVIQKRLLPLKEQVEALLRQADTGSAK